MKKKIEHRTIKCRKVLRNLARYNMKKAGYSHLNDKITLDPETKKPIYKRSLFAEKWREFLQVEDNEKTSVQQG